jgi:hypothetical protein
MKECKENIQQHHTILLLEMMNLKLCLRQNHFLQCFLLGNFNNTILQLQIIILATKITALLQRHWQEKVKLTLLVVAVAVQYSD